MALFQFVSFIAAIGFSSAAKPAQLVSMGNGNVPGSGSRIQGHADYPGRDPRHGRDPIPDRERRALAEDSGELAALVTELDRTLVPEIERVAGPTPEWFMPES